MKRATAIILCLAGLCIFAQDYTTLLRPGITGPPQELSHDVERQSAPSPILTGAINYSIQLHAIESDGFSLPLGLQYRSNGIKVTDVPGCVGFGWSLLPAMRITRTVLGRPDELADHAAGSLSGQNATALWKTAFRSLASDVTTGDMLDTQCDIIRIPLIGKTLTRLIKAEPGGKYEFLGVGDSEYRVTTPDGLKTIHVFDPTGNEYVFGLQAEKMSHVSSAMPQFNATWLLTKIVLGSGRAITFSWKQTAPPSYRHNSAAMFADSYYNYGDSYVESQYSSLLQQNRPYWTSPAVNIENLMLLDRIGFAAGTVLFHHSKERLDSIEIFDAFGAKEPAKNIYFTHKDAGLNGHVLSELYISDAGTYSFEYDTRIFSADDVCSQDAWGYYNGKTANDLTPAISVKKIGDGGKADGLYSPPRSNSRTVDPSAMKANLLHTVTLPGGGKTVFECEPHTFPEQTSPYADDITGALQSLSTGGGLRVTSIKTYDGKKDEPVNSLYYRYGDANVRATPTCETFLRIDRGLSAISRNDGTQYLSEARIVGIMPQSDYMGYDIGELPIWYGTVEELYDEGKKVYSFEQILDVTNEIATEFGRRYPLSYGSVFSSGPQLMSVATYKESDVGTYSKVAEDSYQYEVVDAPEVPGYFVGRSTINFSSPGGIAYEPDFKDGHILETADGSASFDIRDGRDSFDPYPYFMHPCPVYRQTERMTAHTYTEYNDNTPPYSVTTFTTYGENDGLPRRVLTRSDGVLDKTVEIEYPDENADNIQRQMVRINAVGMPVKATTSYGDAISTVESFYSLYGASGCKLRYTMQNNREQADSLFSICSYFDDFGNTIYTNDADKCPTSYFYGYNGQLPVYEISGKNPTQIPIGQDAWTGNAQNAEPPVLDGALVTHTSHIPFVGVSSVTYPDGHTVRHHYDQRGLWESTSVDGLGTTEACEYRGGDGDTIIIDRYRYKNSDKTVYELVSERYDGLSRLKETHYETQGYSTLLDYDAMNRVCGEARTAAEWPEPEAWTDYRYEPSPRGLKTGTVRPGKQWKLDNRSIKTESRPNGKDLPQFECARLRADTDGKITMNGYYEPGTIMMEAVTDEDGHCVVTATDREGHMVLRREGSGNEWLSTYYVYDDYGRLRFVLPPNLRPKSYAVGDADIEEYAYEYVYTGANRLRAAKIPGEGTTFYLHTPGGRLFATSDPVLGDNFFRVHLYDRHGRETVTGIAQGNINDIEAKKSMACTVGEPTGSLPAVYDLSHIGFVNFSPEHVRIYDRYVDGCGAFRPDSVAGSGYRAEPKGHLTATVNYCDDGTYYTETYYYDEFGRRTQTLRKPGRFDVCRSQSYTFDGQPASQLLYLRNTATDSVYTLHILNSYDAAGRLRGTVYRFDNTHRASTGIGYDKLGRVAFKSSGLASRRISYDERDRLKEVLTILREPESIVVPPRPWDDPWFNLNGIADNYYAGASDINGNVETIIDPDFLGNATCFSERVFYEDGETPRFSGLPSAYKNTNGGTYNYTYDAFDRLVEADYSGSSNEEEDFSARYTYDELGRTMDIIRYGVIDNDGETEKFGILDDFVLKYDGARLSGYYSNRDNREGDDFFQRVSMPMSTATRQYSKGRLAQESGIGDIFYAYNRQGRAKATVSVVAGFPYTETSLVRTSDCHGRLMAKTGTIKQGNKETVAFDRHFVEGFVFDKNRLERIDFPGGYFDAQGEPHYLLTDRLGSVVLAVSADNKVEARYGYYPYGEQWRNTAGQQHRLASKERETLAVPGDYDFGPRSYRPGLTLWDNADRYAGDFPWLSPFSYCGANPVKFIDPSGNQICIRDATGQTTRMLYWKKVNNAWGFFDDGGNEFNGNDDFILSVKNTLTSIMGTDIGEEILTFLANDPRELQIKKHFKSISARTNDPEYTGSYWIGWYRDGVKIPTTKGWLKSGIADLFHELAHKYNDWNPKLRIYGEWLRLQSGEIVDCCDRVATHFENLFRIQFNLPLRIQYVLDPIFGDDPGRIIKKDKGIYRSLYFDERGTYHEDVIKKNGYPYL